VLSARYLQLQREENNRRSAGGKSELKKKKKREGTYRVKRGGAYPTKMGETSEKVTASPVFPKKGGEK